MKINIDFVVTWVNSDDEKWQRKKELYFPRALKDSVVSDKARFDDNGELRYALRSIEKFCPWFHKIYIITDEQVPNWLDTSSDKVKIVDHKDIFQEHQNLPTFNSPAIEWNMKNIPGLSEHFINLNDDFFFGRPLSIEHFFDEKGNARLFVTKNKNKSSPHKLLDMSYLKKKNTYQQSIVNARNLVYREFQQIILNSPAHIARPYNKSVLEEVTQRYCDAVNTTIKNRARHQSNVNVAGLYSFYQQARGITPTYSKRINTKRRWLYYAKNKCAATEYIYTPLNVTNKIFNRSLEFIQKFQPGIFCLNDMPGSDLSNKQQMTNLLNQYFPDAAEFELA